MSDYAGVKLNLLAKLVIALLIILAVAGAVWHGFTDTTFDRFWHDLIARPGSTMRFRFVLQPVMAAIASIRAGLSDARANRSPYLRTILSNRQERIGLLNEGLNSTARIILLGVVMDVIYQALVLKTFYPAEAVVIALLLAFVPYLLLRGVVVRLWRVLTWARPAP